MKPCLSLLVLVAAILITPGAGAQELTRTAFDDLRQGGFVVVFRHGRTEEGREDKSPLDLTDCAAQAMLTDASRAQARAIGAAFAAARIPVGKVLASGYCRALEMGRLAFGQAEATDALLLRTYVPISSAPVPPAWPQRVAAFKALLAAMPPEGANTVLITHFPNIKAALDLDVDFGDAIIVKPDGQRARLVARVFARDWASLGGAAADKN
jgi:phosphohistidine phosphatase SixA